MHNQKHEVLSKMNTTHGQIAILIDPEKVNIDQSFEALIRQIELAGVHYIFVGGSTVTNAQQSACVASIRSVTTLPITIFPGSPEQIDESADAILFLNLISGRNPDFLIEHQIQAVPRLMNSSLEIIPTAYILVDGGKETMVQKISKTSSIQHDQDDLALHTALAGVMMGNQVVYLDAGSGALDAVPVRWVKAIRKHITKTIVVGGGIKSLDQIKAYFEAGANLVVIGNHIESNPEFLDELATLKQNL